MGEEYKEMVDAGLVLQIDAPEIAENFADRVLLHLGLAQPGAFTWGLQLDGFR